MDESPSPSQWLGLVVPKRHARRSVTRQLIKRLARAAMARWSSRLPSGCWVLRLRSPLDRKAYPSAASLPLKLMLGTELNELLSQCASRCSAVGQSAGLSPVGAGRG